MAPTAALGAREGETTFTPHDTDGDGKPNSVDIDWDGDGTVDEVWTDNEPEDGTIDSATVVNTGGDKTRSPRGKPGSTRIGTWPLSGGGTMGAVDWDGDGYYDESWWDFDGDGEIDDTDVYKTESKIVDNTKSTRFRAVLVGVKNGLNYPEKDVQDLKDALTGQPASWDEADIDTLTGAAATPAGIQAAIDAAKAYSKPGDEFLFYFSGHGGGYDKDSGYAGGIIDHVDTDETADDDASGDERAIPIPESGFGMDGSKLTTPPAGKIRYTSHDLDGDGTPDTEVQKDENGKVTVVKIGPPEQVIGEDTNGDGKVDGADGGIDVNGDGDKNDTVYVDDTLLVAGKAKVTDDQLTTWLSGFPESVTINVILDSCYSGSFIPDLQHVTDKTGKPLRPGHMEVICAAPADDAAWEKPVSNGVLTQSILDALTTIPGDWWDPFGHHTTAADWVGNEDDITTTRELFEFAAPGAVTYFVGDEDGDGLVDEDPTAHAYTSSTFTTPSVSHVSEESTPTHAPYDDDGDLEFDEDEEPPIESFFDVYYDPATSLGTPRLATVFSKNQPVNITGMAPDVRLWSDVGVSAAATATIEVVLERGPDRFMFPGTPWPGDRGGYASPIYTVRGFEISQTPGFDAMADAEEPSPTVEPQRDETEFFTIDGELWCSIESSAPPPTALPYFAPGGTYNWAVVPDYSYDPLGRRLSFPVHEYGFGKYALLGNVNLYEGDVTPTDEPVVRDAYLDGLDATVLFTRSTEPDFQDTRMFDSREGWCLDPVSPGPDQTAVWQSPDPVAQVVLSPSDGVHYFTLFSRDHGGSWVQPDDNWSGPAHAALRVGDATSTPIAGGSRYQTSVLISEFTIPATCTAAVLATGRNWPDALGASSLAGALKCPLLLTDKDAVPDGVWNELDRLEVAKVYLVGGEAAIGSDVYDELEIEYGPANVVRIAGGSRYETAERVASETVSLLGAGYDGTAFVVTGRNFPDALGAAPLAAGFGWPIYLASSTGLSAGTVAAMDAAGVGSVLIAGGAGAVSQTTEDSLVAKYGAEDVERLAGASRYDTAVELAEHGVANGLYWDGVALATGATFPDALSGGVMQGLDGSVMLLTSPLALSGATQQALSANKDAIAEIRFLGGTGAIPTAVRNQAMTAIQ